MYNTEQSQVGTMNNFCRLMRKCLLVLNSLIKFNTKEKVFNLKTFNSKTLPNT